VTDIQLNLLHNITTEK